MQLTLAGRLATLSRNPVIQASLARVGLHASSVAWEDTARDKNSSIGPNISDLTLSAEGVEMPIIRAPNFADKTIDLSIDKISVTVGNEQSPAPGGLRRIPLREYLSNLKKYTNGIVGSMLTSRDEFLVGSAQACFLPLKDNEVPFHVKICNYQSTSQEPAVLTIMATDQGTSCQTVGPKNRELFFNDGGVAVEMLAERLRDDRAARGVALDGAMTGEEKNRNQILIIQVPLKTRPVPAYVGGLGGAYGSQGWGSGCGESLKLAGGGGGGWGMDSDVILTTAAVKGASAAAPSFAFGLARSDSISRGFDHAMIKKGLVSKGRYAGLSVDSTLERNPDFPIRVTVQLYRVSDTIDIPDPLFMDIAEQLIKVYNQGVNEGSLVTSGITRRPTEPQLKPPPGPFALH